MRLTASWECCFQGPGTEGPVQARRKACPARSRAALPACFPLAPRSVRKALVFSALIVPALTFLMPPLEAAPDMCLENTHRLSNSLPMWSQPPSALGRSQWGQQPITIPFTLCESRSCRCQCCLFQGAHDRSASPAQAGPSRGSHESISRQASNEAKSPLAVTTTLLPITSEKILNSCPEVSILEDCMFVED